MTPDQSTLLDDLTHIATAVGVILTAISSILNRFKLQAVDRKIAATTVALQETKDVAIAVNAEVVKEVHDVGVAAGKAINGGNNKNGNQPESR